MTRFNEIYQITDINRKKELLTDMRTNELKASQLFLKLSQERIRRRSKEFCLDALETYKIGCKKMIEAEIAREEFELKSMREEESIQKYKEMVIKSLSNDKKWIKEELRARNKDLDIMQANSGLMYHPGFNEEFGHKSAEREHPLSWRLKTIDNNGVPLTSETAGLVFGTSTFSPEVHLDKLKTWKRIGKEG